jgi:uncharacterized membrane-anchored protein YjiN (DUF445 family)
MVPPGSRDPAAKRRSQMSQPPPVVPEHTAEPVTATAAGVHPQPGAATDVAGAAPPAAPSPPEDARAAFHRMRAIATGLFLLMAVLFVIAKVFEDVHPAIPFLRAFAEAAMVGALADWFAVTALFRRPLGLPIPHTAIVPRSKDRIGQGLGRFIARNFLQPEQVERRVADLDLAGGFARWIGEKDRARRLAVTLTTAVPRVLALMSDDRISSWLERTVSERLARTDVATLLSEGIELLTRDGRHRPVVDLIIFHAGVAVQSQEGEFRARVSARTDWLPKLLKVDEAASNALLEAIKDTLKEAAYDPAHPLRERVNDAIAHFASDLKGDLKLRGELSAWMREMASHPSVRRYVARIWSDVKTAIADPSPEGRERIADALGRGLEDMAAALLRDEELRASLNVRLKTWAVELAGARGAAVGDLVAETIRGWDARTVVDQIETAVGRDLQYIRINGTVIGGLIGLVIHTVSIFVFGG